MIVKGLGRRGESNGCDDLIYIKKRIGHYFNEREKKIELFSSLFNSKVSFGKEHILNFVDCFGWQ